MGDIRKIFVLIGLIFLLGVPANSLELENNPDECTYIINNIENPEDKELAYFFRGRYYFEKKEYKKAIPDFTNSIKLAKPNSEYQGESYAYRAICRMMLDEHYSAIDDATKAIKIGSVQNKYGFSEWYERSYYTRGISYYYLKKYSAAISDFSHYISKVSPIWNDCDPVIALFLGNAYMFRVDSIIKSEAINSYDDIVGLFNDMQSSINIYSELNMPEAANFKITAFEWLNDLNSALEEGAE